MTHAAQTNPQISNYRIVAQGIGVLAKTTTLRAATYLVASFIDRHPSVPLIVITLPTGDVVRRYEAQAVRR